MIARLRLSQESFTWLLPKHVGCIYTWQHEKGWELKVTFHSSDIPIEINWWINILSFEKMGPIHNEVGLMNCELGQ